MDEGDSGLVFFIFIIAWIVGTVCNAKIAKEKGRNVASAVMVSIIFSPLLSYLYLLAVPSLKED